MSILFLLRTFRRSLRIMKPGSSSYYAYEVRLLNCSNRVRFDNSLSDIDPNLVEEAVKYIIFLVDADKLFDTALGMYDFSLVLLIAQHSQKVISLIYAPNCWAHELFVGPSRIFTVPPRTASSAQVLPAVQDRRPSQAPSECASKYTSSW